MNVITLYHGTTFNFSEIDISKGKGFKDFGKGFYLTAIKKHAENMAIRNANIKLQRIRKIDSSRSFYPYDTYLHTFEVDLDLFKNYNVKYFNNADREWVEFIVNNRNTQTKAHNFDIVVGATADDSTRISLTAYITGLYGEVGSEKALDTLIENLESENLPIQYYFGTDEAAAILKRKGSVIKL